MALTTGVTKGDKRKVAEVKVKLKVPTIGEMIDNMHKLREKKRVLQKELDAVEADFDALKEACIGALDTQGLDKGTGKLASCSISKVIVANVQDWDKVFSYVKKTGHFHLFERRIAGAAFKELLEMEGEKKMLANAGIAPFTKTNLNLRNL